MADDATAPTPPADAAQHEQATAATAPDADTTDWKAEARKWEQRSKENAAAAKRLAALEDANKSETERLNDRAAQAEKAQNEWRGKYEALAKRQAITQAALDAHTTDAETVYLYLADEVQLDDNGNAVGVEKALKALAARKPHLFRDVAPGARDAFSTAATPPALNSSALEDSLRAAVGAL